MNNNKQNPKEFSLILPIKADDFKYIKKNLTLIRENISPRKIVIISSKDIEKDVQNINDITFIDENSLFDGLSFDTVKKYLSNKGMSTKQTGWYLQQFIKLSYAYISDSTYYLSWDADLLPLRKINFFDNEGRPYFTLKREYVSEYFETIERLLLLPKGRFESFIAEHMLFNKDIVKNLIEHINSTNFPGKYFWQKIISAASYSNPENSTGSFSEFETYGTFVEHYFHDKYSTRKLDMLRQAKIFLGETPSNNTLKWVAKSFDTISFEHFDSTNKKYVKKCSNPIIQNFFSLKTLLKDFYNKANPDLKERLSLFDWIFGEKTAYECKKRILPKSFNIKPQLFIDIGILATQDARTGTERVVRGFLTSLLKMQDLPWDIRPVYADIDKQVYKYAHNYLLNNFGINDGLLNDEPIIYKRDDIFWGLALEVKNTVLMKNELENINKMGVRVGFMFYDLIPIQYPLMPPIEFTEYFRQWVNLVLEYDFIICDSKQIESELLEYIINNNPKVLQYITLDYIHLGFDYNNTLPTYGLPDNSQDILNKISQRKTFLVVSTLDKRKMQTQVFDAFDYLWAENNDINLVFVGKQGCDMDKFVYRMESHEEYNKRLFWLNGISDEYLDKVYNASDCIIMASIAEGFGLSIIEGAAKKKKLILRDLAVCREIAKENAFYFSGLSYMDLVNAIKHWLNLDLEGIAPKSDMIPLLSWQQCGERFIHILKNRFINNKIHIKFPKTKKEEEIIYNLEPIPKVEFKGLEKIFAIKNQYGVGKKHKVITIMGIKFKIRM